MVYKIITARYRIPSRELTDRRDTGILNLEVSDTHKTRLDGLSNRHNLPADGMIFVFDHGYGHAVMTMNMMMYDLDFIFLNDDKKCTEVVECVSKNYKGSIYSDFPCKYVLEIESGGCRKRGITEGIIFEF